ncbi:MAG TPA: YncE family protein, partial [Rhodothermales bacterium]|nr:YncE family protein [Rhodothermales bacterium]
ENSQRVGQIQNLPAPRSLAFVNDDKAYATNFVFGSAGLVSVIDLTTNTIQGNPIAVGNSPEGIVVIDDRAFVANYGNTGNGTTLSVIDTDTDTVVSTIDLGCDGPKDLLIDAEEEIVVVCNGKTVFNSDFTEILEQTNGQVLFVNPNSETVVDRILFDQQLGSSNFTQAAYAAPDAEEVYVIAGDDERVYRINSRTNTLATEIDLPDAPQHTGLTAVAYDAAAERLYLARFAQGASGGPDVAATGAVFVYDRSGAEVGQFTVGPSPSHIELVRE